LLAPVLREAASIDPRILPGVGLLRELFERRVTGTRVASGVAVATGIVTLLIACLGIFGVVAYGTALRVREFGIRLALGARTWSLLTLALRQIVWPIAIGMTSGVAAATPIALGLSVGPIQVNPGDPAAYTVALLIFVASAFTAAVLPVIRVLHSNPLSALRHA
jgi:ABC-type antimicrobial peptide transport system permease subunit